MVSVIMGSNNESLYRRGIRDEARMSENFATWLRQKRTSKKLTQKELSELANEGFKQSYVSALEKGKIVDPDPYYLDLIAAALNEPRSEVYKAAGRTIKDEIGAVLPQDDVPEITTGIRYILNIPGVGKQEVVFDEKMLQAISVLRGQGSVTSKPRN